MVTIKAIGKRLIETLYVNPMRDLGIRVSDGTLSVTLPGKYAARAVGTGRCYVEV